MTIAGEWLAQSGRTEAGCTILGGPNLVSLTQSGQLPNNSGTLIRRSVEWKTLSELAFPLSQYSSLFNGGLEPPYLALYDWTGQVRTTLGPMETNELVEFFLKLGGHHIDPTQNGGSPSRKLARWELANQDPEKFMGFLPGNYPLTAGLERLTAVRALLDASSFLDDSIPQFRDVFRARAYDHNGQQLWPATLDADCIGGGLRSVGWNADEIPGSGYLRYRGYQPKFLGMGGSFATLLTLFPSQGDVESYFWCTPGVQAMGPDLSVPPNTAARFNLHMDAYSTNTLMRSHFSDFQTNPASVVTHVYVP